MEQWKVIENHSNYMISNHGRVKHLSHQIWNGKGYYTSKEKILKGSKTKKGYVSVELESKYTYPIHRLVAMAFIPNELDKPHVNHINGVKTDNHIQNLEWVTNQENLLHAFRTGLRKNKTGISAAHSKYVFDCNEIKEINNMTAKEIEEYMRLELNISNVGTRTAHNIRKRFKSHGLTFNRKEVVQL